MKKLLPLLLLVMALVAIVLLFNRGTGSGSPATVWEQDTEAMVDATTLFGEFMQDETGANEKYLNKVVEVSGEVATVSKSSGSTSVILRTSDPSFGVKCRLENPPGKDAETYEVGQSVRFKCICSGYIQHVEMVQCSKR